MGFCTQPASRCENVHLRTATVDDVPFLEQMLFEAFHWDTSGPRPEFARFRGEPEAAKLLANWGRHGDRAIIAELDGAPAGAAWFRLWTSDEHSYGFVSDDVPELGIAVAPSFRSRGIGRALLDALIRVAREDAFPALSLSVSPSNPALRLYEAAGFRRVGVRNVVDVAADLSMTLTFAARRESRCRAPAGIASGRVSRTAADLP